jgi:hypothetical protein
MVDFSGNHKTIHFIVRVVVKTLNMDVEGDCRMILSTDMDLLHKNKQCGLCMEMNRLDVD